METDLFFAVKTSEQGRRDCLVSGSEYNSWIDTYPPKDTSRIIITEKPTIVAIVTKSMFL